MKSKLIVCAYRSWAVNVYEAINQKYNNKFDLFLAKNQPSLESLVSEGLVPDYIICIGWSWIIPDSITKHYKVVGIHPSDLPHYSGGSPLQHQISEGVIDTKNTQVEFDVHGLKQFVNEFERVRYQRISAEKHDPDDPNIPAYMSSQNASNHRVRTSTNDVIKAYSPDQVYISSGRKKDEVELEILKRVNGWLDSAIALKNLKYDIEASFIVQEEILANIFDEELREGPENEYAHEIISMLRDGFADYVVNTPGRLKWRNEVEEENIGRLNYRRADYIDYKDGDIESSIYFDNKDRKNGLVYGKEMLILGRERAK
jgi:hypothetical protein